MYASRPLFVNPAGNKQTHFKCCLIGTFIVIASPAGALINQTEQIKMIMIYPKCNQEQWRSAVVHASTPGHCGAQGQCVCKVWLGHLFYRDRTQACFSTRAHVHPLHTRAYYASLPGPARSEKSRQLVNGKDNLTHSSNQLKIVDYNFTTGQSDWHHHHSQMSLGQKS